MRCASGGGGYEEISYGAAQTNKSLSRSNKSKKASSSHSKKSGKTKKPKKGCMFPWAPPEKKKCCPPKKQVSTTHMLRARARAKASYRKFSLINIVCLINNLKAFHQ